MLKQDAILKHDELEAQFQGMLYANNPAVYFEMYPTEEMELEQEDEEISEHMKIPRSAEEVEALLDIAKQAGIFDS